MLTWILNVKDNICHLKKDRAGFLELEELE